MKTPIEVALVATGLMTLVAMAGSAAAQEVAANRQSPPPLNLPPFKRDAGETFRLPPVHAVTNIAPADEARRVGVIRFVGNEAVATGELEQLAQPYLGRTLAAADIEELRQKITRRYIEGGFINSGAILGEDWYREGVLTLTVVEGRLSAVRLKGLEGLHERYIVSRLVPDEDAALNVDALRERFQLLLADPLIKRAQARIVPDAQAGKALLDVDVERSRPYQLTLFANNGRPASVGENALGVSGTVRNLTGWGDALDLSLQGARQGRGASRQTFAWRMPVGGRGTELLVQTDRGVSSVVEEPASGLDVRSKLTTHEAGISQRLYENLQQRLVVGLTWNQRINRSYLLGEPFSFVVGERDGRTRSDGWRFWQEASQRWENQAIVLRSTFLQNSNNLEAVAGAPDRRNAIWLGQAHLAHRLSDSGLQFSARGTLQKTGDRLSPLDRLSLGGAQSVRGFRENQLIRDQGSIVNLDLDYPLVNGWAGATVTTGVFVDSAQGRNQGEAGARLSSAGLTVKALYGGWRFDLAVALDRRYPGGVARRTDTLQDRGIHFQLNYSVFD